MSRAPVRFFLQSIGLFLCFFCICGCEPKPSVPTVTVWHWMTDRQDALKELARRYEAITGVRINFELYAPSDAYSWKIRSAAQGATLPDIYGILGEKREFSSFIKAGHVLDLTPYMEADGSVWKNEFFAKALAVNVFAEGNTYGVAAGIYGVPLDIMTIQMVYNKDLLAKIGGDPDKPPQTFSEFLALGPKIKNAGLQGLVSGWVEGWLIECFANGYAFNRMGQDKFLATIRGEVPYTDADWIAVFDIFRQLQQAGLLSGGIVTMVNKTAEQLFANEKAVFAFNGSWCVNVYKAMNPDLHFGVMTPPKISGAYPMSIQGGAGSSFLINARSRNKEEAVKFLQWLTDKKQQAYLSEATNNLPANQECLNTIPGILAEFTNGMESATHPNTRGVSEFPAVREAFANGIQLIIIGEKTPEQVAREVQAVKQRELAKRK